MLQKNLSMARTMPRRAQRSHLLAKSPHPVCLSEGKCVRKTIARRYMLLTKDVVNAIFVNAKEPREHKACRIRNNHGKRVEDLISWLDD